MDDLVPPALASKAKRVLGTFVVMIGAGMILDIHALWIGALVVLIGAGVFAWGMIEAGAGTGIETRMAEHRAAANPSAAVSQPTESHP